MIMNWNKLNDLQQLNQLLEDSHKKTVVIFKHSTRCSISRAALDRLERNWKTEDTGNLQPYFLDLISYREISNQIEEVLNVEHESPQLIVVSNGQAVYHRSHFAIDYGDLQRHLQSKS
jgi:bacillithiol system protein YtxJ